MTQDQAFDLLRLGHNIFLTGAAGSGKTYLLNRYIKFLRARRVGVSVTASTGLAATHLNGRTIHSWSGMGVRDQLSKSDLTSLQKDKRLRKRYQKSQVLVIDEVSMLHGHQLDLIDSIARQMLDPLSPFGGLQVILCGDFFQLPPVTVNAAQSVQFAFTSKAWRNGEFRSCYLHEQHRQGEDPLLSVLNDIRSGNAGEHTKVPLRTRYKQEPIGDTQATQLFARNINVDHINQQELSTLNGDEHVFEMLSSGQSVMVEGLKRHCPAITELRLKANARVMFVKNSAEGHYANGTLGEVKSFDEDGWPVVHTYGGSIVTAEPESWIFEEHDTTLATITQVPLKLAWAITVHKSQGMTLDAAEMDLSDAFEPGMGYVALSRVRALSGLKLLGLNEMALTVHGDILSQDPLFQSQSDDAVAELESLSVEEKHRQQAAVLKLRFKAKSAADKTLSKITDAKPTTSAWGMPASTSETVTSAVQDAKSTAASAAPIRHNKQSKGNAYEPWTQQQDEALNQLYCENFSIGKIASQLRRSQGAIRSRLKKIGLVADNTGKSEAAESNAKKAKVRELLEGKLSLTQIAKACELSKTAVVVEIEKLQSQSALPDITHITKGIENFDSIKVLIEQSHEQSLVAIRGQLEGTVTFEELRIMRMLVNK